MSFAATVVLAASGALAWPAPVPENRPWTRWWWLGSAVDEASLTRELELFRAAGIGGVEICPIYGVQGWEARNVPFLSPRWMELFGHTLGEARRLGMVVDLTTGTGWPFGGPWVADADASSRAEVVRREVVDGKLSEALPAGRWQYLLAVSPSGERVDLTSRVGGDGRLDWTGAAGTWRLYGLVAQGPVQKVKRAAPGGEGSVLDPYSTEALGRYLAHFDQALAGLRGGDAARALPRLVRVLRGELHAAALRGVPGAPRLRPARRDRGPRGRRRSRDARARPQRLPRDARRPAPRVRAALDGWAHAKGSLSRNQAHGAPGDLLDLYAAADIPETEVFRRDRREADAAAQARVPPPRT